ncbi:MAG: type III-A CRISPR-associated protein Csm2 [Fidelibacterota bacterium]
MTHYNDRFGLDHITAWVQKTLNRDAIGFAEWFGRELAYDHFTNSQIRNIYGEVKRQQMSGYNEAKLLLLKPKLAYAAKRQSGRNSEQAAERLKTLLAGGIDAVVSSPDPAASFENFADFFEAILAYHKANEGKRRPGQFQGRRR